MSDRATTETPSKPKVVEQAIERLKLAAEAEQKQREREKEALKFQVPEFQWTAAARNDRKGQTIGGVSVAERPTLSIPKLDQPIQIELNKERDAHLGVTVHALSEDADDDTAEVIQDLYRRIETDSRANLARSWAFERAVKAGRGAYRILTEWDPSSPKGTNDTRIVIKRLLYQEAAYFDPFATEPDWCDGEWAFVTEWVQFSKYKRRYGKKKNAAGDDVASDLAGFDNPLLEQLAVDCPEWIKGDGEARAVLVVEYFAIEGEEDNRTVVWRKMNAVEVLEQSTIPGRYIPLVPVIGRELIPFDGERRWTGIIEPNMDGQRFFNYSASTVVENMAQEPKATWVLAEGQEEGHEQEFLMANVRNFPYVRYKPTSLMGTPNPPPQRSQVDTSKLALAMQGLSVASEFLHSGTGYFDPSLGKQNPNVKTKGGTLALQDQTDRGNSNWLDNLANISLTYEAKVVLGMIPVVYDRPGRLVRLLDLEDNGRMVMLNAPFQPHPQTTRPQALPYDTPQEQQQTDQQVADPSHPAKRYDLTKATYGVAVTIGKSYKTRVDSGRDQLGMLFQAEPELIKIGGDIYFKFADFPGHNELADRFKKMLPPQLQEQKDGQADPRIELEQAKAMVQQMQQQIQEMGKALETDKVKADAQVAVAKIKQQTDVATATLDRDAKIVVAAINAKMSNHEVLLEAAASAGELLAQHRHDAVENELDRMHERDTANAQAQHDAAMGAAGAGQQAEQAGADRQHEAEMGQQGHQQALEQGQQAADLAPEPAAGA
jgi:hypothetical protein